VQAKSLATRHLDPYRAGLELGEGLAHLDPEVVFLFSSIHYGGSRELLEGLFDALPGRPVLIGATGDGIYEASGVADTGASVLGITTGGAVSWHVASALDVANDTEGALDRCADRLDAATGGRPSSLCFLLADFHADAAKLVTALGRRVTAPIVGGLAGDEYRMERCYLYANGEVLEDAVVMLAAVGDLRCEIHVAGELAPVGRPGVVNLASGTRVQEIDGLGAQDFFARQVGKPISPADIGVLAMQVASVNEPDQRCLRTILQADAADGSVTLFGGVGVGQQVQLCYATPEGIVRDARAIGARLRETGFVPEAGLVISCAGRKFVLGHREDDHEVGAIREGCGRAFPLAGFPSFGEIGPRWTGEGYTSVLFHNMTYILLVFGHHDPDPPDAGGRP
jgi:hypothetical protein